jgi:hypothetical protein
VVDGFNVVVDDGALVVVAVVVDGFSVGVLVLGSGSGSDSGMVIEVAPSANFPITVLRTT